MHCRHYLYFFASLLLLLPARHLPAQAADEVVLFDTFSCCVSLYDQLYVLPDDGSIPLADVLSGRVDSLFVAAAGLPLVHSRPTRVYGRVRLQRRSPGGPAIQRYLITFPMDLSRVELYQLQPGGYSRMLGGSSLPFAAQTYRPDYPTIANMFEWYAANDSLQTFYFRIVDYSGLPYKYPTLYDERVISSNYKKSSPWLFFLLGALAMVWLYNLWLLLYRRDRLHLYYILYLSSFIIYLLYSSNVLMRWLAEEVFAGRPAVHYYCRLNYYLLVFSYLNFIQSFLNLRESLPRWQRLFDFFKWLGLGLLLASAVFLYFSHYNIWVVDTVFSVFLAAVLLLVIPFALALRRLQSVYARFVLLGITAMLAGGLPALYGVLRYGQFMWEYLIFIPLGGFVETMVFIAGLAYRQYRETIDRMSLEERSGRERWQNEVYANLTHELRSPLTIMLGIAEQLAAQSAAAVRPALLTLARNGRQMLSYIDSMLDLSRHGGEQRPLQYQRSDIIRFLRYQLDSFRYLADGKGVALIFESPVDSWLLDFAPDPLQSVVSNLLSNALKFTDKGGRVQLRVLPGPMLELQVIDTGRGIAAEELPRIFDRFYRSPTGELTAKGSGIGLALSRELVAAMQGVLEVKSKPGEGSVFSLRLPVGEGVAAAPASGVHASPRAMSAADAGSHTPAAGSDQASPEKPPAWAGAASASAGAADAGSHTSAAGSAQASPKKPPALAAADAAAKATPWLPPGEGESRPLILLADDHPDLLAYLSHCFSDHYDLQTANDGREALQLAERLLPDLLICDLMMPGMSGLEVCSAMKSNELCCHIPIVLLTSRADDESVLAGFSAGADAYLTKPFSREQLLLQVRNLLETRRKLYAYYRLSALSPPAPAQSEDVAQWMNNDFIRRIVLLVSADYTASWEVSRLSKALLISSSQLHRKLKSVTGMTTTEFVRYLRLHEARRQLLAAPAKTVQTVALEVGFESYSDFNNRFKELFGMTPGRLRDPKSGSPAAD